MTVFVICADLLREAAARKWIIALFIAVTGVLVTTMLALRLDVVDGALAATEFFGKTMNSKIKSVDVALRPLFEAVSYTVFYGGIMLGILLCSGFAPSLLSEGRIEHLLSLPVRRIELLAGTLLGVLILSLIGCLYGTVGLTLILGVKTAYWTSNLIVAGLFAIASFSTIYAAMLTSALFVRSASFTTVVGACLFILGIVAGHRNEMSGLFEPGVSRTLFEWINAPLPRISQIGLLAGNVARAAEIDWGLLVRLLLSQTVFGAALFVFGVWLFERKEF